MSYPPPPPEQAPQGWPTPPPSGGGVPQGPPYGYPHGPYGGWTPAPAHPQGTTILVLGIVSLAAGLMCLLPMFLGIPAWVMGHRARREAQEGPVRYSNEGSITAGWVLGIVSTSILIAIVAIYATVLLLMLATS